MALRMSAAAIAARKVAISGNAPTPSQSESTVFSTPTMSEPFTDLASFGSAFPSMPADSALISPVTTNQSKDIIELSEDEEIQPRHSTTAHAKTTPSPHRTSKTTPSPHQTDEADESNETLYCICRRPYTPDTFMIGCDKCHDWFHGDCVLITEEEAENMSDWFCPKCEPAVKSKKSSSSAPKKRKESSKDSKSKSSSRSKSSKSGASDGKRQRKAKELSEFVMETTGLISSSSSSSDSSDSDSSDSDSSDSDESELNVPLASLRKQTSNSLPKSSPPIATSKPAAPSVKVVTPKSTTPVAAKKIEAPSASSSSTVTAAASAAAAVLQKPAVPKTPTYSTETVNLRKRTSELFTDVLGGAADIGSAIERALFELCGYSCSSHYRQQARDMMGFLRLPTHTLRTRVLSAALSPSALVRMSVEDMEPEEISRAREEARLASLRTMVRPTDGDDGGDGKIYKMTHKGLVEIETESAAFGAGDSAAVVRANLASLTNAEPEVPAEVESTSSSNLDSFVSPVSVTPAVAAPVRIGRRDPTPPMAAFGDDDVPAFSTYDLVDQLSGSDRELDWAEDDEPAFVVGDDLLMLGDLDPEETEYKRGLQKEQQREEQKQRREQERQRRKDKEAQRLKAQPQPQQQQQPIAVPSVGQIPVLPQTLSASNVETDASGVGMPVWEGALGRPDGGEFFVSCTQHGGPRAFTLDLPAVLHTAGRLKYSAVSDFLPQVAAANAAGRRRVVLISFAASSPDGAAARQADNHARYDDFARSYATMERCAVFDKERTEGWLMYVMPPMTLAGSSMAAFGPQWVSEFFGPYARPPPADALWGLLFMSTALFDQGVARSSFAPRFPSMARSSLAFGSSGDIVTAPAPSLPMPSSLPFQAGKDGVYNPDGDSSAPSNSLSSMLDSIAALSRSIQPGPQAALPTGFPPYMPPPTADPRQNLAPPAPYFAPPFDPRAPQPQFNYPPPLPFAPPPPFADPRGFQAPPMPPGQFHHGQLPPQHTPPQQYDSRYDSRPNEYDRREYDRHDSREYRGDGRNSGRGRGGRGGGGDRHEGRSNACYKCDVEGHRAFECTQGRDGGPGRNDRNRY